MPRIFISYRRSDSAPITERIYARLVDAFGRKNVFKDVDDMRAGKNFLARIEEAIIASDVILVVIGREWINAEHENGGRRLDDPRDYVRHEIEMALRHEKRLIPVIVEGARVPSAAELPVSINTLTDRHAAFVRPDPDFERDIRWLVDEIAGRTRRTAFSPLLALGALIAVVAVIALLVLPALNPAATSNTIPTSTNSPRETDTQAVAAASTDGSNTLATPTLSITDDYQTALAFVATFNTDMTRDAIDTQNAPSATSTATATPTASPSDTVPAATNTAANTATPTATSTATQTATYTSTANLTGTFAANQTSAAGMTATHFIVGTQIAAQVLNEFQATQTSIMGAISTRQAEDLMTALAAAQQATATAEAQIAAFNDAQTGTAMAFQATLSALETASSNIATNAALQTLFAPTLTDTLTPTPTQTDTPTPVPTATITPTSEFTATNTPSPTRTLHSWEMRYTATAFYTATREAMLMSTFSLGRVTIESSNKQVYTSPFLRTNYEATHRIPGGTFKMFVFMGQQFDVLETRRNDDGTWYLIRILVTDHRNSEGSRVTPSPAVARTGWITDRFTDFDSEPLLPNQTSTPTTTPTVTNTYTSEEATLAASAPTMFGHITLESGFERDPYGVSVPDGNDETRFDGCAGYFTSLPSYILNYTSGQANALRFYLRGSHDSTLVVRINGNQYCDDDSYGTNQPTVDIENPASGRYEIWVGTFSSGVAMDATLYITEDMNNQP